MIRKKIVQPLAQEILQGTFVRGNTIVVDVTPDGFVFQKAVDARPEPTG